MSITWDPKKSRENELRHGVRFVDIEGVFYDAHAITLEDEFAEGEQRFVTIGSDGLGRVVVVCYAHRQDRIRVISARRASPGEMRTYEEGI